MNNKKKTLLEIQNIVLDKYKGVLLVPEQAYSSMHSRIKVIDIKYGPFYRLAFNVVNGNAKHPERIKIDKIKDGLKQILPIEEAQKKLNSYLKIDPNTYKGMHKKCIVFDSEHGPWLATPHSLKPTSRHPNSYSDRRKKLHIQDLEIVKKRIFEKHGDNITIIEDTYKGVRKKATFTQNGFGSWEAMVYTVIDGSEHPAKKTKKTQQTNIKKYGVKSPSQNREIALRQAKSINKSEIKLHWKTAEELICVGSYESKTVDWLNNNQVEYLWQPKVFKLKNTTYRPDFYLVKENIWIEIKGYQRPDFIEKWSQFTEIIPNSLIWDRLKLKSLGIKVK